MSGASRGGNAKRGRGGGTSRAAGRSEDDIRVSKKLSRLLRHNPPACVDKSGWVPIEVVKSTLGSVQDTAQILRVVHSDEKGRFQVRVPVMKPYWLASCLWPLPPSQHIQALYRARH